MVGLVLECFAWVARPDLAERLAEQRYYPPDRVPVLNESVIQWQVFDAATGPEHLDYLLLGDSSCLMGLRPESISAITGSRGWNLGTIALLTPLGHGLVYAAYADRRGAPPIVVYQVNWRALVNDWLYRPEGLYERFRGWFLSVFGPTPFPPSRAQRFRVRRWLVPDRNRQLFEASPRGPYPSDREVRAILHERRGAFTETEHATLPPAVQIPPAPSNEHRAALARLISEVTGRGSSLVLMLAPLPELARTPENLAALASWHRAFESLADRPRVAVYEPFARFHPDADFATEAHLTEPAAQRESRELGRWLLRREAER